MKPAKQKRRYERRGLRPLVVDVDALGTTDDGFVLERHEQGKRARVLLPVPDEPEPPLPKPVRMR